MKVIYLLFVAISFLTAHAIGKTEMTASMSACRNLTIMLWDDFLGQGKKLPANWTEIPSLEKIKAEHDKNVIREVFYLNEMAIVKGTPVILKENGISYKFHGSKIFALGRKAEFDGSKISSTPSRNEGRNAILVAADNSEIIVDWIPEPQVQIILRQLNGFKPEEQPLAFDDQFILENKNSSKVDIVEPKNLRQKTSSESNSDSSLSSTKMKVYSLWIICALFLIFLVVLGLRLVRSKRSPKRP